MTIFFVVGQLRGSLGSSDLDGVNDDSSPMAAVRTAEELERCLHSFQFRVLVQLYSPTEQFAH